MSDPTEPTEAIQDGEQPPRQASPFGALRDLTTAFIGQEAVARNDAVTARLDELAKLQHELDTQRLAGRADELRERAAHRAVIRAAANTEARARAAQQVAMAVAFPFLLMAAMVVLVTIGVWVGAAS